MSIINQALANESSTTNSLLSGGLINLVPYLAIFLVFYFFLIRPQVKKQKELQSMVNSLQKGDKVVAAGGIIGKINKIEDNIINLEISNGNKIQVMKSSVTECLSNEKINTK